ncbi:hypothetical protein KACC15558_13560 [Brevibacterium ammoniilyticum]|uniref:Activator of Hsp90 ATPase homologue 1/2-like C-terminal domain-containing protein n=1 Tax=Brevibacterium ammoniilyticum TaxID=1046555 RepID=A0ABP9U075_9MICO
MSSLPPIHREIVVHADPATAFAVFTERIGAWWPLDSLSISGTGATVAFVDGVLVETAPDGTTSPWGEVTEWVPPKRLAINWHPGHDPEQASQVSVEFTAVGDQTLVVLEHAGWERFADAVAARQEYDAGWPKVLSRYQAAVGGTIAPTADSPEV